MCPASAPLEIKCASDHQTVSCLYVKEGKQTVSVLFLFHVEFPERCPRALSLPWSGWSLLLQAPVGNILPEVTAPT